MNQQYSKEFLDGFFGSESKGETLEERVRTSKIMFVRTQDHLAFYNRFSKATGIMMTAEEVLEIFGIEKIIEADDKGSAIIVLERAEPAASFINMRNKKGLTQQQLADLAGVSLEQVKDAEDSGTRTHTDVLVKICKVLDMDPKRISFHKYE